MRLSASEVDWSKLSERARWALEEVMPRLTEGYDLAEIAKQLDVDKDDVAAAHALLEAEAQKLAGRTVIPEHTPEEFEALKASITEHGQMYDILLGSDGMPVDGRGRLRACRELKIEPKTRTLALPADQLQSLALAVNVARRHLTVGARRGIARAELLRDPSRSDVRVAAVAGVSDKIIASIRRELETTSEIPKLPERVGADGKARKASAPAQRPEPTFRTIRVRVANENAEQLLGRWVDCRAFRLLETRPNVYELQVQLLDVAPVDEPTLAKIAESAVVLDARWGSRPGDTITQILADASSIFGLVATSPAELTQAQADWCLTRLNDLVAIEALG